MKFIKSSILAVLALGATLTACNETSDVVYVPGAQDPGAFFASDIVTAYNVAVDATSLEIAVSRTSDLITEAKVSLTDESKFFTAPSSVVFEQGKATAPLTLTFDPSKMEEGKAYPLILNIADASTYGLGTYKFTVTVGAADVTEKFGEGKGIYVFNNLWTGGLTDVAVTKTYNPKTPTENVTITLKSVLPPTADERADINIHFASFVPDAEGNIEITSIDPVFVREDNNGKIYYRDAYSWLMDAGVPDKAENFKGLSTYNVNTGLFTMMTVYYAPEVGPTASYGQEYEYFQMDGFPDYSVAVEYQGYLTKADGSYQALANVTSGDDVAKVRVALVAGDDEQALINVLTGADESKYIEYEGETAKEVRLGFSDAGAYMIGAMTFDADGNAQELAIDEFEVSFSDDNADWTDIGNADFGDGWILPPYLKEGYTTLDVLFAVPMQQNKKDPSIYRLVQPYGSDFVLADQNQKPSKRNIQFQMGEQTAFIGVQPTGFADEDGEYTICNYEGRLAEANPGVSEAAILAFLEKNGVAQTTINTEDEELGTYIEVPVCLWSQDGEKFYSWKSEPHAYIFMPGATASAKAKLIARNVARPVKGSMLKSVRSNAKRNAMKTSSLNIPVLTNKVKAYSYK